MKLIDKFNLKIFSFVLLIISILTILVCLNVINIENVSMGLYKMVGNKNVEYVVMGLSGLISIMSLKSLFFTNNNIEKEQEDDTNGILLQNGNGKLLITVDTISSLAEAVISGFDGINTAEVNVSITDDNEVLLNLIIDVKSNIVIKDITSELQTKLKKGIKSATDLELKEVNVIVRNVEPEEPKEGENNE